jgi:hypothetical protein
MDLPVIKSNVHSYEFVPADTEELLRWCKLQAEFYEKFDSNRNVYQYESAFSDIRNQVTSAISLGPLAQQIKLATEKGEVNLESLISSLQTKTNQLFNQFGLPPADSEVGLQLDAHLAIDPTIGIPALYALSTSAAHNNHFQSQHPALWRGLGIGASLSLQRSQKQKPQRYAKTVRAWINGAQSDLARTRTRAEQTVKLLRENASDFKKKISDFEDQHAKTMGATSSATENLLSETKQEIERFKLFVKHEIALKAPVTYWETKAA